MQPLVAGTTYYFTIYVGAAKDTTAYIPMVTDFKNDIVANIGAYFSTTQLRDYANPGIINVVPQINFPYWDIPVEGKFVYTKLMGTYTATGGERYLTIGNFDRVVNCNFNFISKSAHFLDATLLYQNCVYYDDLSLVSDTTLPLISLDQFSLGNDTMLKCKTDRIRLGGESDFISYTWNTGDTSRFITTKMPGTY